MLLSEASDGFVSLPYKNSVLRKSYLNSLLGREKADPLPLVALKLSPPTYLKSIELQGLSVRNITSELLRPLDFQKDHIHPHIESSSTNKL